MRGPAQGLTAARWRAAEDRRRLAFLSVVLPALMAGLLAWSVFELVVDQPLLALGPALGCALLAVGWWCSCSGYPTSAFHLAAAGGVSSLLLCPILTGDPGVSPYLAAVLAGVLIFAAPIGLLMASLLIPATSLAALAVVSESETMTWPTLVAGGLLVSGVTGVVATLGVRGVSDDISRVEQLASERAAVQAELTELRQELAERVSRRTAELEAVIAETELAIESLGDLALIDPLTDLPNRRFIQTRALAVLSPASDPRHDLGTSAPFQASVCLLDLDHFKTVNDLHSHATGDEVLARAARLMSAALEPGDRLCRWGGDEFLALLPGVDRTAAEDRMHRLQRIVAAAPWSEVTPGVTLGVTWGTAEVADATDEALSLAVEEADRLLLAAKVARERD